MNNDKMNNEPSLGKKASDAASGAKEGLGMNDNKFSKEPTLGDKASDAMSGAKDGMGMNDAHKGIHDSDVVDQRPWTEKASDAIAGAVETVKDKLGFEHGHTASEPLAAPHTTSTTHEPTLFEKASGVATGAVETVKEKLGFDTHHVDTTTNEPTAATRNPINNGPTLYEKASGVAAPLLEKASGVAAAAVEAVKHVIEPESESNKVRRQATDPSTSRSMDTGRQAGEMLNDKHDFHAKEDKIDGWHDDKHDFKSKDTKLDSTWDKKDKPKDSWENVTKSEEGNKFDATTGFADSKDISKTRGTEFKDSNWKAGETRDPFEHSMAADRDMHPLGMGLEGEKASLDALKASDPALSRDKDVYPLGDKASLGLQGEKASIDGLQASDPAMSRNRDNMQPLGLGLDADSLGLNTHMSSDPSMTERTMDNLGFQHNAHKGGVGASISRPRDALEPTLKEKISDAAFDAKEGIKSTLGMDNNGNEPSQRSGDHFGTGHSTFQPTMGEKISDAAFDAKEGIKNTFGMNNEGNEPSQRSGDTFGSSYNNYGSSHNTFQPTMGEKISDAAFDAKEGIKNSLGMESDAHKTGRHVGETMTGQRSWDEPTMGEKISNTAADATQNVKNALGMESDAHKTGRHVGEAFGDAAQGTKQGMNKYSA